MKQALIAGALLATQSLAITGKIHIDPKDR